VRGLDKLKIKIVIICGYCGKIQEYLAFENVFTNKMSFKTHCDECNKIIMECTYEN